MRYVHVPQISQSVEKHTPQLKDGLPRKCLKCSPTTVAEVKKMATMTDEKKSMTELEGWIEQLMECKQLSENQVHVQDL